MGNVGHQRFVFFGSVGLGSFIENCQDGTQVGHIDNTWRNTVDEVRSFTNYIHY